MKLSQLLAVSGLVLHKQWVQSAEGYEGKMGGPLAVLLLPHLYDYSSLGVVVEVCNPVFVSSAKKEPVIQRNHHPKLTRRAALRGLS